jgi:HPt (histidine-containing phosphotransfer) domain-containing protein
MQELVGVFLDNTRVLMSELRSALHSSDLGRLKRTAHTLRGSASNLWVTSLAALAEHLESAAQQNDRERASALFSKVQGTFESVRQAMHAISADD